MYQIMRRFAAAYLLVKMVCHRGKRILCALALPFKIAGVLIIGFFGVLLFGLGELIETKNARKVSLLQLRDDEQEKA